jgi:NADH-quinone oxidoreductase subunit J
MNTVIQLVFFILSALVLVSGLMVVVVKNIVHATLWLIASFAGVAALYFLMEAPFIGVVQVLVYAGAVAILMLFAIMLTRQVMGEATRQLFERWWVAAITSAGIFLLVLIPTIVSPGVPAVAGRPAGWPRTDPLAAGAARASGTAAQTPAIAGTLEIGRSFMQEYLLPFEVASILLLVALIGAVVIAYEERSRRRRILTLAEEVSLRRTPMAVEGVAPLGASGADVPGQAGNTARTY